MTIAEQIRTRRKRKKLTQRALAERLAITTVYMNYLEKGKMEPSLPLLRRIAEELSTTASELLK